MRHILKLRSPYQAFLLFSAVTLISSSAFAAGDPTQTMSPDVMKSEIALYKNSIADTPCKNLVPLSGLITGGAMPGFEAHYETFQLAQDSNSKTSAKLIISWITQSRGTNTTTVSFQCAGE